MNSINKDFFKQKKDGESIRINKYLSDAGFCSRREADRLVEEGKVLVNGTVAVMGQKVSCSDLVMVNGKTIQEDSELILLAFNKPEGIECTTAAHNPSNIIDFIKYEKRIYPIGRLDKNSTGLILLTNTGELVNEILKASNFHEKEYTVKVNKLITSDFIEAMGNGVRIELQDGAKKVVTRKCKVTQIDKYSFSIVLTQGLNRQIRRMCKALGYEVISLKRLRILNIKLNDLPEGKYRPVTEEEIAELLSMLHFKEGKNNG